MITKSVSKLGIYVKHGEDSAEDVFYYHLPNRPDHYMMVPAASVLKPKLVKVTERQPDWEAVGCYNDHGYGVWITTQTQARHAVRIAEALLDQVDYERREKERLGDLLGEKYQRITQLEAEAQVRASAYAAEAAKLNAIQEILA